MALRSVASARSQAGEASAVHHSGRGPSARVTTGEFHREVLKAPPISRSPPEVCNDPNSEWVATNVGKVFAQHVGGSAELSGGRGADYLDVMALPVHLTTADGSRRCFGDGIEIGDSQAKGRIGLDRETKRHQRVGGVLGQLRSAIVGGGAIVSGDHPTVVLGGRPRVGRPTASIGVLLWISVHVRHCGLVA